MNRIHLPIFALILVSPAFAADTPAKPDQPALAGGYSSAEIDSEVRTVAEFAVKTKSKSTERPLKLIKILKAERQVVAGLNFRFEIEVADGSKNLKARAVVWKKLHGLLVLTSWDAL
ncbi:MAG: cystatin domain-containing protein [Verrucomicrobiota bacterium]